MDHKHEDSADWRMAALTVTRGVGGVTELASAVCAKTELGHSLVDTVTLAWLDERAAHNPRLRDAAYDEWFLARVRTTLRCSLKSLHASEGSPARLEKLLLQVIGRDCGRALAVWKQRVGVHDDMTTRQADVAEVAAKAPAVVADDDEGEASWSNLLEGKSLSLEARTSTLMALTAPEEHSIQSLLHDSEKLSALCRPTGEFDLRKLAGYLGLTPRTTRKYLERLKKEIARVKAMVPRSFQTVYDRLTALAAGKPDALTGLELRQLLFDLVRSLAVGFDPTNFDAQGVQKLRPAQFNTVVDSLLGERDFCEASEDRSIMERIMQQAVRIREALEMSDVNAAYVQTAPLVLDAARLQDPAAPERLQILINYVYLLELAGWYDACLEALRAIEHRCDALAAHEGPEKLDTPPTLEHAQTLRRVRTFARANAIICAFYYKVTTANREAFKVADYDELVALADQYDGVFSDDPDAEAVHEDALVVRAHVLRASYNFWRRAKGADKEKWGKERTERRRMLVEFVEKYFWDDGRNRPDAIRLVEAAHNAGEDYAADRTLDVLANVLRRWPDMAAELDAERRATEPILVPNQLGE